MNTWKPIALFSTAALVCVLGHDVAFARSAEPRPATVANDYVRLRAALDSLQVARAHLLNSEHNHGGWRDRAIIATDKAIHETEAAINWAP